MLQGGRQMRSLKSWCRLGLAGLLLGMVGCGHDGSASIDPPPSEKPAEEAILGVVRTPNGLFTAAPALMRTLRMAGLADRAGRWIGFGLASRVFAAYTNPYIEPVGEGHKVVLSRALQGDAADGAIDGPETLSETYTNPFGQYEIVSFDARRIGLCRLMVSVGGDGQRTRAFVLGQTTDVDASSEALVRVILERLTQAPPLQLCQLSVEELKYVRTEVERATVVANGDTVEEINDSAFEAARRSGCVRQALGDVTGGVAEDGLGPAICPGRIP